MLKTGEEIAQLRQLFGNDPTLVERRFLSGGPAGVECCVLYFDGMSDADQIAQQVIRPVQEACLLTAARAREVLRRRFVRAGELEEKEGLEPLALSLQAGDCLFFAQGAPGALVVSAKGFPQRSVEEPQSERAAVGSREGFTESIIANLALLRRRVRSPRLRVKFLEAGETVRQKIAVCYLEGLAPQSLLDEVTRRLDAVKQEDLTDAYPLCAKIMDKPLSPFRTAGLTERPDTAASKLLEGRVGLLIDGSPVMITAPFFFIEHFQGVDDYHQNFLIASFSRVLRLICFFVSLTLPALYVSMVQFHQELIPTKLLLSIAAAREGVPFPLVLETLILLIAFELLRDASYRMSPTMGQSLSIVGALVLGEASVSARLVSAPLVIVAAATGAAGLCNPQLKTVSVVGRFGMLLIASFSGFYGVIFGLCVLLLSLCATQSFGYAFTDYLVPDKPGQLRDALLRAPWARLSTHSLTGRDHGAEG